MLFNIKIKEHETQTFFDYLVSCFLKICISDDCLLHRVLQFYCVTSLLEGVPDSRQTFTYLSKNLSFSLVRDFDSLGSWHESKIQDRRYTNETATMHYYIVARDEFLIIIPNLSFSLEVAYGPENFPF